LSQLLERVGRQQEGYEILNLCLPPSTVQRSDSCNDEFRL
jgi:hypothetical protein